MNIEAGIEMFRFTVTHALLLVAPILGTAMAVGLLCVAVLELRGVPPRPADLPSR